MEKTEVKETGTWMEDGRCCIKRTERLPVYDDERKEIRGWKDVNSEIIFTRDELLGNFEQHLAQFSQLEGQLKSLQRQIKDREESLEELQMPKVKTAEMIRLERTLKAVRLLEELDKLKRQEEQAKPSIEQAKKWLDERKKLLDERPQTDGSSVSEGVKA